MTPSQRATRATFQRAAELIASGKEQYSCLALKDALRRSVSGKGIREIPLCLAYSDTFTLDADRVGYLDPFECLQAAVEKDENPKNLRVLLLLFAGEFFLTEPETILP